MRVLFPDREPREADRLKAARTLFAGGGFADYPGPAALLRHDGTVIMANGEASRCAAALGLDEPGRLHPALAAAIRSGAPGRNAIELAVSGGGPAGSILFEYTVIPLVRRENALMLGRMTTLERNFRAALVESRQRYKDLVCISSDFYWETGPDGRFVFVSPGGAAGFDVDALAGAHPAPLLAEPETDEAAFSTREPIADVDIWVRRADGALACFVTTAIPLFGPDGDWQGARGLCRDVTATRESEAALARAQARERLMAYIVRAVRDEIEPAEMLAAAADATSRALGADACRIFRVDETGRQVLAASWGAEIAGVGTGLLSRVCPDGRPLSTEYGDCRLLCIAASYRDRNNGALLLARGAGGGDWTAEERSLACDVALQLGIALAQVENHLRLEALSRTDSLTGLLNRRAFNVGVEARLERGGAPAALLYVDLDNFKPFNDALGHQKGDEALKLVARMLEECTRPGDLVGRLGGDEFALWLDRADEATAARRARDLVAAAHVLARNSGASERPLGLSIGIAINRPGSGEALDALIRRADAAMYRIKRNGNAGYAIAEPAPNAPPARVSA